jgi:hypothetical protein
LEAEQAGGQGGEALEGKRLGEQAGGQGGEGLEGEQAGGGRGRRHLWQRLIKKSNTGQ